MARAIEWDDLRQISSDSLKVGDTLARLGLGTAYHIAPGGVVRGVGWAPCDAMAWEVTAISEDGVVTARRADGLEASGKSPASVLVIDGRI